jgi:hypothetical protein
MPRVIGRRVLVPAFAGVAVALLVIGIVIGRSCKRDAAAPVVAKADEKPAQLVVTSQPVEANVLIDGRFVGVSPVERIDLDPGKHSVVIDAFGYQPYAGTVEIEAHARATLKVLLAPIGGGKSTGGELVGKGGKASNAPVPATALSLTGTGASKDAPKPPARGRPSAPSYSSSPSPSPPVYEPPPRPRRDCSGEKSQCRDSCSRAKNDCRFNCPHCVTCSSSVGSTECTRQCESCRTVCEQNTKFCESSCDGNFNSCSASQ